jgi:hypothetical protein
MNKEEYWRLFRLLHDDVQTAIGCNISFLAINRIASKRRDIYDRCNLHSAFWNTTTYALQAAFFMAIGRIFDKATGSFSIEDLVEQTIEHPGFFSKAKPTRKDLEPLRQQLAPHVKAFPKIYGAIRHKYFAHRSRATKEVIHDLFSKTNMKEVAAILKSVHNLIGGIEYEMQQDGRLPAQWRGGHYDSVRREYQTSAESFMLGLVTKATAL